MLAARFVAVPKPLPAKQLQVYMPHVRGWNSRWNGCDNFMMDSLVKGITQHTPCRGNQCSRTGRERNRTVRNERPTPTHFDDHRPKRPLKHQAALFPVALVHTIIRLRHRGDGESSHANRDLYPTAFHCVAFDLQEGGSFSCRISAPFSCGRKGFTATQSQTRQVGDVVLPETFPILSQVIEIVP
ncbi:MAG: hypothetical protein FD153_2043 [Rhodospirillaceae bacterium]|nr:MAG: hypothetical protein FD153_2043 [Rhodospirillaceae bacterium]